jgi:hypothetical protein
VDNNNAAPARSRGVIQRTEGRPNNPHTTPTITIGDLKAKNPTVAKMYDSMPAGMATGVTLPLTAHHIIPWNILRDFWNVMMENGLYKSAEAFLATLDVDKNERSGRVRLAKEGRLPALQFDQLKEDISWAPGNLVWGPSNRVDDPGEEIDNMSAGAGGDGDRIRSMVNIGESMDTYISNYGTQAPSPEERARRANSQAPLDARLSAEVKQWRSFYAKKEIVRFQLGMWFIQTNSPTYSPPAGGNAAVHPRWKLNTKGLNS